MNKIQLEKHITGVNLMKTKGSHEKHFKIKYHNANEYLKPSFLALHETIGCSTKLFKLLEIPLNIICIRLLH